MRKFFSTLLGIAFLLPVAGFGQPEIMTSADLGGLGSPEPDFQISYGENALQFGNLRIPTGDGPHPVIVFLHGGCWLAEYGLSHTNTLNAAFASNGFATWSLEYRRVGDQGGSWPGTFQDVAAGTDHLRLLAREYNLDLDRVITAGHSAGGHLALWLAARTKLPANTTLSSKDPLPVKGVLALAPAADLGYLQETRACENAASRLMGGSPAEHPDRYQLGDPMRFAPTDAPQRIVIGKYDFDWAPAGMRYFERAKDRGDDVQMIEATESGHFEMIDPGSSTWPIVLRNVKELLAEESD